MAEEMWRRMVGYFNSNDDANVLVTIAVPRHARATLRYAEFENSVPEADQTFDAWWQAVALVPGVRIEADLTDVVSASNFAQFVQKLQPILMATKGWPDVGTPANTALIDTMVSKSRDFGNIDALRSRVLGLAINNSGPMSNTQQGWSLVYTSFDETLTLVGYLILEIVLEWPANRSMPFPREHVANEENQDNE